MQLLRDNLLIISDGRGTLSAPGFRLGNSVFWQMHCLVPGTKMAAFPFRLMCPLKENDALTLGYGSN